MFLGQNDFSSVDLNGLDESFLNVIDFDIGIANIWTISGWIKPLENFVSFRRLISLQDALGNAHNNIEILTSDFLGEITCRLLDSSGTLFKSFVFTDLLTLDSWSFIVLTWDGTTVKFYHQGVEVIPTFKVVDDSGTMTSVDRRTAIFSDTSANDFFKGRAHSFAIWNVDLTPAEILALHNGGKQLDFGIDRAGYISASNLLHYWRLGKNSETDSNIGEDSGKHSTLINVMVNAQNITVADVVNDYPGI